MSIYTDLITSEHSDRPDFVATVDATTQAVVDIEAILALLPEKFDIDVATGVQLDAVGLWIGRTRRVATPLTGVYFTWGAPGPGWGDGVWQGQFDPDSGLVDLDDDSYRTLLKAKIAANSWDGTIPGAYAVWEGAFNDGSIIIIQDNQDMSMTVGIAGAQISAVIRSLLTGGYIPLKPSGVKINFYMISSNDGPIFAWGAQSAALDGWGIGSWAQELPVT